MEMVTLIEKTTPKNFFQSNLFLWFYYDSTKKMTETNKIYQSFRLDECFKSENPGHKQIIRENEFDNEYLSDDVKKNWGMKTDFASRWAKK